MDKMMSKSQGCATRKKWGGVIGQNQDHTTFPGSQFFKQAL
jgi:hypothetical protein